jgi:hypothetical protein
VRYGRGMAVFMDGVEPLQSVSAQSEGTLQIPSCEALEE